MNSKIINMDYYRGNDSYSDGIVEDEILDLLNQNIDIDKLIREETRWEILYHLSPFRRNLLEWMDFDKFSSALEVGSGCGALTGLLCENIKKVVGVELSKKRANIISERCKEFNNLELYIGDVTDIPFPEKSFDLITLIGVLEYAGSFSKSKTPHKELLLYLKQLLNSDGKLVIAIENKYGIKYWAGAREDHTSKFFHGIENYQGNLSVRTFGKGELLNLIEQVGLKVSQFLYPFPDYKLPSAIYSENSIPSNGYFGEISPNYDMDRIKLFDENIAMDGIISNQQFPFFANSFLVVCEKE